MCGPSNMILDGAGRLGACRPAAPADQRHVQRARIKGRVSDIHRGLIGASTARRGAIAEHDNARERVRRLDRHEVQHVHGGIPQVTVHLDRGVRIVAILEQVQKGRAGPWLLTGQPVILANLATGVISFRRRRRRPLEDIARAKAATTGRQGQKGQGRCSGNNDARHAHELRAPLAVNSLLSTQRAPREQAFSPSPNFNDESAVRAACNDRSGDGNTLTYSIRIPRFEVHL